MMEHIVERGASDSLLGPSSVDVDLFVIGAGSGGVRAAKVAAGYGAQVMIAEEHRVGGTCVIRGCVPKKLMVYASRIPEALAEAKGYGWNATALEFDWKRFSLRRNSEVLRLEKAYKSNLERSGVQIVHERAVIEGPHLVRLVATGDMIHARNILIAVGSRPLAEHAFPGSEFVLTSNDVFLLEELPKRLLIVGGGYIAMEFASVFAGLGCEVTLLLRGEKTLRGFDDEISDNIMAAMRGRGIRIATSLLIDRIDMHKGYLSVTFADGSTSNFDRVLGATGRVPNTAFIGIGTTDIILDSVGAIPVNEYSQTTEPSIYAVGDVTNRANLTPIAIREGQAFADTVFGRRPTPVDHSLIATAVFTTPEIGTIGLTEAAAVEQYGEEGVDIYKSHFRPMRSAFSGSDEKMFMKVVVDRATDRVLGVHVVGHEAGEIIQSVAIAVTMGATKSDFDRTVAVHPTMTEELVTMRAPFRRAPGTSATPAFEAC